MITQKSALKIPKKNCKEIHEKELKFKERIGKQNCIKIKLIKSNASCKSDAT